MERIICNNGKVKLTEWGGDYYLIGTIYNVYMENFNAEEYAKQIYHEACKRLGAAD